MYKNGMSLMRPPAYKISLSVLKPLWYRSAGTATAPERVQSVVVAASLEIPRHAARDPLDHARQQALNFLGLWWRQRDERRPLLVGGW